MSGGYRHRPCYNSFAPRPQKATCSLQGELLWSEHVRLKLPVLLASRMGLLVREAMYVAPLLGTG